MRIFLLMMLIFTCGCSFYSPLYCQQEKATLKLAETEDRYSKIIVCSRVFEALGKIGDYQARDILIKGLKSKEFLIRAYAAGALGKLKDKGAVPSLKKLVSDENYLVRILAAKSLLEIGQLDMEEYLLNLLRDKDPVVRDNVVEVLGEFGNKYLPNLIEVLSEDNNYLVRVKAIEKLGQNKFAPAAIIIRQVLEDENPFVRQAACSSLAKIGDQQDIPLLMERLSDSNVIVRAAAKEGLSLLGERSVIKLLWQDIEDKDPMLRTSSYVALANLRDVNILAVLLKEIIAPENQAFVKKETARALRILKPYISDLVDNALARSEESILSLKNLEVNYKVDGQDLILVIVSVLRDEKNPLYQDAPLILKELQEKASFPFLREALSQKNPIMVASVAYVLGALQDKEAVSYLIDVCKRYGF